VGIEVSRAAVDAVHADVPDNVAAHLVQEVGDVGRALAAAPRRLTLDLHVERSACMPMEGKGVYAVWDTDEHSVRVHTSTQARRPFGQRWQRSWAWR
jgi:CO/xanthine dehydrogenase Mo-binding subunit